MDAADVDNSLPRPLRAPRHRPSRAQEPDHEHVPRPRLRRGRHAEGTLPALSRGKDEGRARTLDVRRLLDHLDRLAASVRADRHRRRPRHPVAAILRRGRPPPRLRDDDSGHPHGTTHRLELARLAADHRAVGSARAGAPFVSEGHGRGRHRSSHRRFRGRGGPRPCGRPRRLRALRARAPRRTVLVARREPPYRRLRRKPRQPRPVHHGDPGGDARTSARSLPDRHAVHHGRARGGGTARGRRHGNRAPARRRRARRLPQRHRRDLVRQRRSELHRTQHVPPHRAAHRPGEAHPQRVRRPRVPREPGGGPRIREPGGEGRMRRHDRHDPRPHRGPAPGREAPAGRREPRAHLCRRGLLHRPDLRRGGCTVPPEPGDGPRGGHAARHRAEPGAAAQGGGGRSRAGRSRGGAGVCVARSRRGALRSRGRAGRAGPTGGSRDVAA